MEVAIFVEGKIENFFQVLPNGKQFLKQNSFSQNFEADLQNKHL